MDASPFHFPVPNPMAKFFLNGEGIDFTAGNDVPLLWAIRDWFGLTPAEARLAASLAEGASLEDFASTRGVSLNAARFLLKGVFAKTETNRQPHLVAKLQAAPLHWSLPSATPDLPNPLA
jgi:DNA-binding CsgD family transcriptional regulator